MIAGFYNMVSTGAAGTGFGIVSIFNGVISGADVAGGILEGTYTERAAAIDVHITIKMPAGSIPVQTGIPLTEQMIIPIDTSLPHDLGNGQQLLLQLPLGPINIVFRKIRNFP